MSSFIILHFRIELTSLIIPDRQLSKIQFCEYFRCFRQSIQQNNTDFRIYHLLPFWIELLENCASNKNIWRILLYSKKVTHSWNDVEFTVYNWALRISGVFVEYDSHNYEIGENWWNYVFEKGSQRWWWNIFRKSSPSIESKYIRK